MSGGCWEGIDGGLSMLLLVSFLSLLLLCGVVLDMFI